MDERARLFIAFSVSLPQSLQTQLTLLQKDHAQWRWQTMDQYHVTLAFLGEVMVSDVDALVRCLHQFSCADFPLLRLERLGIFPNKASSTGKIFACHCEQSEALMQFQRRLHAAVSPWSTHEDVHGYQPHVTLARSRIALAPPMVLKSNELLSCQALVCYESLPAHGGSVYRQRCVIPAG